MRWSRGSVAMGAFATILCTCAVASYFPEHGVPFVSVLIICVVYTVSNSKRIVQFWKPPSPNQREDITSVPHKTVLKLLSEDS